jgi:plastocyanin
MKSYLASTLLVALSSVAFAEEHVIEQNDRKFSVQEVTIKPGDSIVFKNVDQVTHNVFSNSTINAFDIRIQQPGNSSTVEFKQAGVTEVRCAIHPGMKLLVTVK